MEIAEKNNCRDKNIRSLVILACIFRTLLYLPGPPEPESFRRSNIATCQAHRVHCASDWKSCTPARTKDISKWPKHAATFFFRCQTKARQAKTRCMWSRETRACIMMAPSLSSHHLKQERRQAFCGTRHGKIKPLWNNQRNAADEHRSSLSYYSYYSNQHLHGSSGV